MRHSGEHDERSLYSSMELETAVRLKLNITVILFRAGGYNMVAFQQDLIYGRTSGTDFGMGMPGQPTARTAAGFTKGARHRRNG